MSVRRLVVEELRGIFGERLQEGVPLASYTSARVGGAAETLLTVNSKDELESAVEQLWKMEAAFVVIGGGSNVLVSDEGVRELVILNRARKVRFDLEADPPTVWAESGTNFGAMARQAAQKGLSGLEWAGGIPGTVGGAVLGNAGAHDGEMKDNLLVAEILHRKKGKQSWSVEDMDYRYRSSALKRNPGQAVVLAATLQLCKGKQKAIEEKMDEFLSYRRKTQPPGASMGSMFKNPSGDYAGRLIEAAGLKGLRVGDAQISELHANFFMNLGEAKASDVYELIQKARGEVADRFGEELELEIELIGEWQ